MPTGTLAIDRAAGGDPGVARVHLYGPRGGVIGDTLISVDNAHEAIKRLERFAGPHGRPANLLDTLLNAAEAVLDSDCGAISLGELATALHAMDPQRDYRTENPYVTPEM